VVQLQESNASEVPPQLTSKLGGPLAVKPQSQNRPQGQGNSSLQPQAQQYLVSIRFDNPDDCIYPGTLAQVKIHCQWRSCGWWLWRSVSSSLDLGLL
jgi:putative peptide zinc metalloprotease protein